MLYSKKELEYLTILSTYHSCIHPDVLHRIFHFSLKEEKNIFSLTELKQRYFFKYKCFCTEKQIVAMKSLLTRERIGNINIEGEKIRELCRKNDINMIYYGEKDYPSYLYKINTPPYILFVRGRLPNEKDYWKSYAIVGTRQASEQGILFAKAIGKYLHKHSYYNISGLAKGIDTIGHQETLGRTGAILGQGLLGAIYPPENRNLAQKILKQGGFLLSELPPQEKISSLSLLRRNRLQAAFARGIIIVETGLKGGTITTYHYAKKQGKEIYVADFNEEFIEKYKDHICIIKNIKEFKEKSKNQWIQKNLLEVIEIED